MFPRKFVYLAIFLVALLACIPTYYGITYSANKVDVLAEEIKELTEPEDKGKEAYSLTRMHHSEFTDFEIKLVAKKFDLEDDFSAEFEITAAKPSIKGGKLIGDVKFQMALAANWIKFESKSSSRTISVEDMRNGKYNYESFYLSNLNPLVERTNYMIPFPKPTAYILASYKVKYNTDEIKNIAVLLDYEYLSYEIIQGGYPSK